MPLHLVAVPIGNLEDITLRAQRVLREADLIACEDTRRTGQLLTLLGLPRPRLVALHDHNEAERAGTILAALDSEQAVVLVSDAGTPTISDPGFKLVRAAIDAGYEVVPVPGPSAVVTALCASGLPTDRFRFLGFAPRKRGLRTRLFEALRADRDTLVFYVGPHRLQAWLDDAAEVFGAERPAVIARELTKRFESFRRGTLGALAEDPGTIRGEIVVLVGGAPETVPEAADLEDVVAELLESGLTPSKAARDAAKRTGASREAAYEAAKKLRAGRLRFEGAPDITHE